MPKLAFTISSYRLHDFVKLGLKQLQKLSPDSPILVSDDKGPESEMIRQTAEEHGATYRCPKIRKGHFANDYASIMNSVAFAEAAGADVAIKVSQRFIFRKPESIDVIQKTFSDPNILAATPGRPRVMPGKGKVTSGFGNFGILSDVVMIRVGAITPEGLLIMYRERLLREKVPWASFVECTVDELHTNKFPGRTTRIEELTNPSPDPSYLRRYQATEGQYRELALSHGLNGSFPLLEWAQIEQRAYLCKPVCV
jgi:hypothetical protein